MSFHQSHRRGIVAALIITISVMGMGMGLAAADDRADDALEDDTNMTQITIDEHTRIVDWEIDDGHGSVVVESDRRQPILLSDAVAGVEALGATRVPEQETELAPGRNELSMSLETYAGDSAMTVSTRGGTIRLSSGIQESDDPFTAFGGASGLMFGIIMTVGLAVLGSVYVLKSEQKGVEKA